jgi:hypothetical protein
LQPRIVQDVIFKDLFTTCGAATRRGLAHDAEKSGYRLSKKIMIKQQAKAKWRFYLIPFCFSRAHPASTIDQLRFGIVSAVSGWGN